MILRNKPNKPNKPDNPELAPLSPWQAGHDYDPDLHGDEQAPESQRGFALAVTIAVAFVSIGAALVLQWLVQWGPA